MHWTDTDCDPSSNKKYFHLSFDKYFPTGNIFVLIGLKFLLYYLICLGAVVASHKSLDYKGDQVGL